MLLLANFSTWLRPNKVLPIFMGSSLTAAQGPLPVVSKSGLHSRWLRLPEAQPLDECNLIVSNVWFTYHTAYLITFMPSTQSFLVTPLVTHKCSICCCQFKKKKKGKGYEHSLNKYLCDYGLKKYKYNNVNKLVMVKMPVKIRSFSLVKLKKNGKENRKWLIYGIGEGVEKKAYSYLVDGGINSWITYVTIKN